MTRSRQVITSLRGGICTLPPIDRRASECEDSWNVLFSNTHGAYRRPGTEIIGNKIQLQDEEGYSTKNGERVKILLKNKENNEGDKRIGTRAMFVFPVKKDIYQVLLLGSGVWEMFFIDLEKGKKNILNRYPQDLTPEYTQSRNEQMILSNTEERLIYDNSAAKPQEIFRAIKAEGKIWIVNKTTKVNFTLLRAHYIEGVSTTIFGNRLLHDNTYLFNFLEVTSGNSITSSIEFIVKYGDPAKYKKYKVNLSLGEFKGIETMGELFQEKWESNPSSLPKVVFDAFTVTSLRKQAALVVKDPHADLREDYSKETLTSTSPTDENFTISNLKFKFNNIAVPNTPCLLYTSDAADE